VVAWFCILRVLTVECPSQDARAGGFANAARTGEEVGMVYPSRPDGIAQRGGYVLLANNVGKAEWTPLSGGDNETLFFCHDLCGS
jgi:hypothetical protein